MYRAVATLVAVAGLVIVPVQLQAQGQNPVVQEIRTLINSDYAYSAENLKDRPGATAEAGSQEFWSSGGLLQNVPADAPAVSYVSFNLVPKYITVTSLADGVAMAQFYVEGSYQEVGSDPVDHYFTRATEVFVRENGEWKIRAAHWSPVVGGSGTRQTAIIR